MDCALYVSSDLCLSQTKDDEAAYKLLCQLMHVYGYRDVYSPDLSVLQVGLLTLTHTLTRTLTHILTHTHTFTHSSVHSLPP